MRRLSAERAVLALQKGDRIMVTHPDPMKATDRTTYALVSGGGLADGVDLPQPAAAPRSRRGWALPGRAGSRRGADLPAGGVRR